MGKYLLRRLVIGIPVLLLITLLDFVFINLAPGDPVQAMINPDRTPPGSVAYEEQLKALGLDQPLPIRYVRWLGEMISGNLGYSYMTHRPVTQIIGERLWNTFKLAGTSLLFAWIVAVPIGILAAVKQYSWFDYAQGALSFLWISIPAFFIGLLAIYLFSLKLGWLPVGGVATIGETPTLGDHLRHLLLPTLVLGLGNAAWLTRYARNSMLEVLSQEYLVTARAKGLKDRVILWRHALPNAVLPLITLGGLQFPELFGGAVIVETIFSWPGLGRLGVEAAFKRDYTVMMGLLLMVAVLVFVGNLLADIGYAIADPRIRYE